MSRDEFLRATGFGRARSYFLEHDGRLYDSKAVAGYAHGISVGEPLGPADFSGGENTVARQLEKLGFTMLRMHSANGPADNAHGEPGGPAARAYCRRCGFPFATDAGHQELCHWQSACDRRLHDPSYRVPPARLALVEVRLQRYLIDCARNTPAGQATDTTVTYGTLCHAIDPEERYWAAPRFSGVRKVLARIGAFEHAHSRPMLTALVVRSGSRRPGPGFAELCADLGYEVPGGDEVSFWRAQIDEVVQYWSHRTEAEVLMATEPVPVATAEPAALAEVLDAIRNLRTQKGLDGLAKRHQPLALLWAIGRVAQGQDALAPWPVAKAQISELIGQFGRPGDRRNPHLPFLALGRGSLWKITPEPPWARNTDETLRQWLGRTQPPPRGGLSEHVIELLSDPDAAAEIVASLLGIYLSDADTETLLQTAGINGLWTEHTANDDESQAARNLIRELAKDSAIVPAERRHTLTASYQRAPGNITVRRGEAQLVDRFLQTLPASKATRLQLPVGLTDLYDSETGELIEAKVSAEHRYVRQALGQLLDYAAHCDLPVNLLTALFPAAPAPSDTRLLHRYGIDCLYWTGSTTFHRLQAPLPARERIRAIWSTPSGRPPTSP